MKSTVNFPGNQKKFWMDPSPPSLTHRAPSILLAIKWKPKKFAILTLAQPQNNAFGRQISPYWLQTMRTPESFYLPININFLSNFIKNQFSKMSDLFRPRRMPSRQRALDAECLQSGIHRRWPGMVSRESEEEPRLKHIKFVDLQRGWVDQLWTCCSPNCSVQYS